MSVQTSPAPATNTLVRLCDDLPDPNLYWRIACPGIVEQSVAADDLTYRKKNGRIIVLDKERLEESACKCYKAVKQEYDCFARLLETGSCL